MSTIEEKKFLLQVDPHLTFNVNTQIKEQLKWLIGIGQMEAGDLLPSTSQLADELELNRNTINWVYSQLRDEGLVIMQKGRGTQITAGNQTKQLAEERKPMQQLIDSTVREAEAAGFDLKSFFLAGLAYTLLQPPHPAGKPRVLLLECNGHDHPFYRQQIEQATHGDIETFFLDDAAGNEDAAREAILRSDIIVTTLNHADEAKALCSRFDKKVVVIGATVDTALLLEIASLKQGSHVAFVCLGKTGGEWMANRIREAGITALRVETLGMDERDYLSGAVDTFDKIYASAAVFPELKKMLPDKTELFPMKLEMSSASLLQDIALQSR
ncbi:GntR family transcriptional regulator [Paenibacillus glycinis]|uniref:GntR family transcriptional regulator n=1 Tax=Paenibacillus glycinis TaxID=2697035 RepID=A0ABW9XPZ4_9BACL|nr:GntR family transcriptional regulator [Paenibacillus glycinis]NBD24703.1 GntR family transcriptional regulator [Paenibacillus glycinis]